MTKTGTTLTLTLFAITIAAIIVSSWIAATWPQAVNWVSAGLIGLAALLLVVAFIERRKAA